MEYCCVSFIDLFSLNKLKLSQTETNCANDVIVDQ